MDNGVVLTRQFVVFSFSVFFFFGVICAFVTLLRVRNEPIV